MTHVKGVRGRHLILSDKIGGDENNIRTHLKNACNACNAFSIIDNVSPTDAFGVLSSTFNRQSIYD